MRIQNYISALIIMTLVITLIPSASAWDEKTHSDIVDAVYYGLSPEVQKNLNLGIMETASKQPDVKYKDFRYHSYPESYTQAVAWLGKGKAAYDKGDYSKASYDYGIASHYISDTFSAPHGVENEDPAEHSEYENQAENLKPTATYIRGDLHSMMESGYNQGKTSWSEWLQTKNSQIIQNNLNDGASASLSAVKDSIDSKQSFLSSLYYSFLNMFTSTGN